MPTPDSPRHSCSAIGEVAALYRIRFQQEAVLRLRRISCISLNRAGG